MRGCVRRDGTGDGNSDIYMFTIDSAELTPLDRTDDLKDYVETTLSCNAGTKKALIKPLDESIRFLENGQDSNAVLELKPFINLVEKIEKSKRISAADADYMITEARGIIDQIKAQ
jgi:TolB protein